MSVTDEAVTRIKSMIASGELPPGSRLPRLESLAGQLGLSRTSLREAVRELTTMNILVSRQGDGTYVSMLRLGALFEAVASAADVLPGETGVQLLRLREILEPEAAALAAMRATELDVHQLRAIHDEMVPGLADDELVDSDLAFHHRLVEMSGDGALASLVGVLSPRPGQFRFLCGRHGEAGRRWIHTDHERILRGVAERDIEAARAAAKVHVNAMRRRLEEELLADELDERDSVDQELSA
jgi:GntR family transcriptional regulator, transcriptional repressor for pyruvate dehydrogenase complex